MADSKKLAKQTDSRLITGDCSEMTTVTKIVTLGFFDPLSKVRELGWMDGVDDLVAIADTCYFKEETRIDNKQYPLLERQFLTQIDSILSTFEGIRIKNVKNPVCKCNPTKIEIHELP